jgi:hypothetical protein
MAQRPRFRADIVLRLVFSGDHPHPAAGSGRSYDFDTFANNG